MKTLTTCECGAEMPARNIGSHRKSKKHSDAMGSLRRNGRGSWSTKQRYNPKYTEGQRNTAAQKLTLAVDKVEQAKADLKALAYWTYDSGYMTIEEVAEFVGVHKVTLFSWFRAINGS